MNGDTKRLIGSLQPAVASAVTRALENSNAGDLLVTEDAVDAAQEIIAETTRTAAQVIVNQTNREPWYQSNVTLGSLLATITSLYAFVYGVVTHGAPEPAEFALQIGPVVGGLWALYGRWVAAKPLPIGPQA